jgi:hypothetical protein
MPTNPFLLTQEDDTYVDIPWEFTKTSISGIRIESEYVRPGRDIQLTINLNEQHTDRWVNPSGTSYQLNLYRKNLGYTQEIMDSNFAKNGY